MRYLLAPLVMLLVPTAQAQDGVVTLVDYEALATFTEACRLAIDARNRLYVVDKGREVVVQLDVEGQELARLGGPGGRDGEFDEPLDFDPGAGLTWLVADAGNGRLQRFSQTFLHLETLAVPRKAHFEPGTPGRLEPRDDVLQSGWPVAVAQSPTGETFAIEAYQSVVLKWDKSRRLERAIGGFGLGEATLEEPVALAVNTELLYVADRGSRSILVYDLFGGYVRTMARGLAEDVRALVLDSSMLWIVLPSRLLVMDATGRKLYDIQVREDLDLVDAVPHGGDIFLLTPTQLLRVRSEGR